MATDNISLAAACYLFLFVSHRLAGPVYFALLASRDLAEQIELTHSILPLYRYLPQTKFPYQIYHFPSGFGDKISYVKIEIASLTSVTNHSLSFNTVILSLISYKVLLRAALTKFCTFSCMASDAFCLTALYRQQRFFCRWRYSVR